MQAWIQYDSNTNKITNVANQSQAGYISVYVDQQHSDFFKSNYNQIIYDSKYGALLYPDDYQSEQQLTNNNSYAYNSLASSYNTGITSFSATVSSVNQTLTSFQASAASNATDIDSNIANVKQLAQIQDGHNYLTASQQGDVINYFLTNTPLQLTSILSNIPVKDVPVSLGISVQSDKWQYIVPQFDNIPNSQVVDNTIIISGKDANTLQQTINTQLAQQPGTIWAILHYGSDINITDAGVYYGSVPTGKTIKEVDLDINSLESALSSATSSLSTLIAETAATSNSSAPQKGTNYLTSTTQSEVINYIVAAAAFNQADIFAQAPSATGSMALQINANSPSWQYVIPQLQGLANVSVNGNTISINGNGKVDLSNNIAKQFSQNSTNVWAILHYGSGMQINSVGLYYV